MRHSTNCTGRYQRSECLGPKKRSKANAAPKGASASGKGRKAKDTAPATEATTAAPLYTPAKEKIKSIEDFGFPFEDKYFDPKTDDPTEVIPELPHLDEYPEELTEEVARELATTNTLCIDYNLPLNYGFHPADAFTNPTGDGPLAS